MLHVYIATSVFCLIYLNSVRIFSQVIVFATSLVVNRGFSGKCVCDDFAHCLIELDFGKPIAIQSK